MLLFAIVLALLAVRSIADLNVAYISYYNDFIEPSYILDKNWSGTTVVAQQSIIQWADWLAAQGPWSVTTSKPFPASSNNTHDYLSWAPYYWPNCTGVGNTTQLTPQQVWVTCPYYRLDGESNPDTHTIDNRGAFVNMSDAVLYNALAWAINGSSHYATNVASWINTWFIANDTYMNPNLNYSQVVRGPGQTSRTGRSSGVIDLKCMVKVVNAVLVLRAGQPPGWTSAIDSGLVNWTKSYIKWLTSSQIALAAAVAPNNHGSYYYSQLAALQILVNDTAGANATIQKYFSTLYKKQISADGEQPFEAVRTRPYHYRSFNIAAMITNARLGSHLGFDAWNLTTSSGSTIKSALDFTMSVPISLGTGNNNSSSNSSEEDTTTMLLFLPSVGTSAIVYGDEDGGDTRGRYVTFLESEEVNYPAQPWFFWDQPLDDSGWVSAHSGSGGPGATTTSTAPTASPSKGKGKNGGELGLHGSFGRLFLGAATLVSLHILLFV
ncbi:chondroitin AC/alginate lyase [Russula emetica]|nr:chondroitin AC/alginate lyase [Russula emetica]